MRGAMVAVGLLALAGGVHAQEQGEGTDEATVLAGPRVDASRTRASLVERSYEGSIEALGIPAAEAAVELLDLDEATRAKITDILAARAAILDAVVIEHVDLLQRLRAAREADDRPEMRATYAELRELLAPLDARGSLREEIAGVLSEAQASRYRALIDEYERAIVDEARSKAREEGRRFDARRFEARERFVELGRELRRSYERQIEPRKEDLERLMAGLQLDEAREAEVRRLVSDYAQRTKLNPTDAQRRELVRSIFAILTPEERRRAVDLLQGREPVMSEEDR